MVHWKRLENDLPTINNTHGSSIVNKGQPKGFLLVVVRRSTRSPMSSNILMGGSQTRQVLYHMGGNVTVETSVSVILLRLAQIRGEASTNR
mmetsp:Transcript_20097/g.42062  ORF Transcript_20097/g.42062 Transcript_20097/m.42062 type:complete len:91 (+) Transcript_20097:362-634(+)